jgi:hypothetical protein
MKNNQFRQGDVYIKQVTKLPDGLEPIDREKGKVVLAHGEVTGHMHAISEKHVQHFRDAGLEDRLKSEGGFRARTGGAIPFTYLEVNSEPATLRHEEHDPIVLDPGLYEIRIQREYTPQAIKSVQD